MEYVHMIQRDSLATLTLDTLPFNIAVLDEDGTILFTNQAWREFGGVGSGSGEMVGVNYFDGIDESADDHAAQAVAGIREVIDGRRDIFKLEYPCHSPDQRQWFLMRAASLSEHEEGQVVVAHIDITQRKLAELRAREQRHELQRIISRVNGLVSNVMEAALQASSRGEIESQLCSRLAEVDPYVGAWVGHVDLRTDGVVPTSAAGGGVPPTDATLPKSSGDPTATAYRTGETQVVRNVDEQECDEIHRNALSRLVAIDDRDEHQRVSYEPARPPAGRDDRKQNGTLAAFPLVYNETKYGVLTVYGHGDAFDEREVAVLDVLARVVSTAINAIESTRILASDNVVELELSLSQEPLFFAEIATALDCTLAYEGAIYHDDGTVSMLFVVEDGDPEAVLELATEDDAIDDVTHVSESDDKNVFEFYVDEPPVVSDLAQRGAETTDIIAHGRSIRITLELPASEDVRTVIQQLSEKFPSTELVARHEHERPDQTKQELITDIEKRLTDRQRLALRKAFLGGFFDWPRGVSGEELAASMDITPSTYHQHLRTAERKVLATLFEE
jgi:PAS domain S-box-containing protein